ncbi:MAG TPA: 3-phosphoshikimate 1-carboxyvinyltransferase [Victivallales bacterium]|nr:3-phosphoshikimate 1-carboxyvinyltransferase [Victivallales bacterium]HPO90539.1 3-phosphoshikimate 1-carboxyvinyltransferase [Victivallales bacterium]
MNLKISNSTLNGEISVPGSKSHTIRAVAIASMAEGYSTIVNPLLSGDTLSSLNAAEALGAEVERKNDFWRIKGIRKIKQFAKTIDLGNSGTSLRIFTALSALGNTTYKFDGDSSLRTREMKPLLNSLEELGAETSSTNYKCPLSVRGPLRGGHTTIDAKSSQFLTALLLASPLIRGNKTEITVTHINEKPYIEITLDWLKRQEIEIDYTEDFFYFSIPSKQAYKKFEYSIPADFSTATFPLLAASITKGEIKIKNLDFNDYQGDKEIFSIFEKMGVHLEKKENLVIVKGPEKLKPITVDLNSTPDALPALSVAMCFAEGKSEILNVPQARIKETDRIASMTCELRKMGAEIEELPDGMIIYGKGQLNGKEVNGHEDHRIIMALCIAGLAANGDTIVNGVESAGVTYPGFIKDFKKLGANFSEIMHS